MSRLKRSILEKFEVFMKLSGVNSKTEFIPKSRAVREEVKPKDRILGGCPHITVLKVILLNEFLRRENVTRE